MSGPGEELALAEELEDVVQHAEALRVLDGLAQDGGVAPDRLAAARIAYQDLSRSTLNAVSDLAALQQRLEQLLVQLQQVQLQQEILRVGFTDPVQVVDKFREDRDKARLEAVKAADIEESAVRQAQTLQQRFNLLTSKLHEAEEERRAELAPDLHAAKEDLSLLRTQLETERAKAASAGLEVTDIAFKLEALQLEVEGLKLALVQEQEAASNAELQPSRVRYQEDLAVAALKQLREEEHEVAAQLREQEAAEQALLSESKDLAQQHAAAAKAADRLRNRVAVREREVEEVVRDIEMAKVETEKLLAEQVAWDLEVEKKKADAKREADGVKAEQRGRTVVQQRLNRAEVEVKQAEEVLPDLRNSLRNMCSQLGGEQRAQEREAAATMKLAGELAELVEAVAAEKKLTGVQAALVKATMADVRQVDEECAAVKEAAAERDKAIQAAISQRDASARSLNQRLQRLSEVVDEAESKDGELEELRKKRAEARSAQRDLRDLCGLMTGQMGRFQAVVASAQRTAQGLAKEVQDAEAELAALKGVADDRAHEVRDAERCRARSHADKAALVAQLGAVRRQAAAAIEAADTIGIQRELVVRGLEEGQDACVRLRAAAAAALEAKQAAQRALLDRSEEMCGLYERSAALQRELDAGTLALAQCGDDMRVLQLEIAELQRRVGATHKTAPDVDAYDRQIAALKAQVLRARNEAEGLGSALESPADCPDRCRVLPGRLPSRQDLTARIAQIEERLAGRKDLAAQKDIVLEELEQLTEALVEQARVAQHPALDISLKMNKARRGQQQLTRRMMATVSELSLYQAVSLKCAADRDALRAELAAAQLNVASGRPPTAGADQEFKRMERDREAEAEVRAQAAELRQLKADGLLGAVRSAASPRPQAYIPEELGVPKPFPGAFRPFKPTEPPAAVAVAAAAAAQQQHQQREAAPVQQQGQDVCSSVEAAIGSPAVCRVRSAGPGSRAPAAGSSSSSSPVLLLAGVTAA